MRELKFRVWNSELKKFEYFKLHNITIPDRLLCQHLHPVQEWTGFVDRHGKDIYEGDLLGESLEPIELYRGKFMTGRKGSRNFDLEEFFEDGLIPQVTSSFIGNGQFTK
jgi:hypothetical protein